MLDASNRNSDTSAIITGGAQGLGLAVARQLVGEGCRKLALLGRSAEKGKAAVAELQKAGAEAIFIAADMADPNACLGAVETALKRFGTINALVNSGASTARGTLVDTTVERYNELFDTNARGPFFLMQAVVRHLLETKQQGSIVNVLSVNIHCGQDFLTAYSGSKGALATMTKNVAAAYRKDRIRCNAVSPGWMDTPGEHSIQKAVHNAPDDWLAKAEASMPFGKLAKPDELAVLIAYLVSPQSGVMTGSVIDYDQNVIGLIG
jgi:NAD(P)-dependent dehydrogenase (short-subunit alcohol dehydrogenase family)